MEFSFSPSQIVVKDREGNVILDVEPFDIDVMQSQAQQGIDTSDISTMSIWVQRLQKMIEEEYDVVLSRTNTWELIEATRMLMGEMKKKLHSQQKLASSTESMLSSLTPSNS